MQGKPSITKNTILFRGPDIDAEVGHGHLQIGDIDFSITIIPNYPSNPKAPTHHVYRDDGPIKERIGGVWLGINAKGAPKRTLHLKSLNIQANLAPVSGAHENWWSIIPWSPQKTQS
ncbi:hypothetical protein NAC44_20400 [Allorhizobium sp. BGMRC 0089]|uniref:hypothetical protein n=1 Tax=Allorhizobium sonneratiae TaxID=2934936 RepID=UPI002033F1A8|nr:hypothetical protein [Allorhizobium sonneratiae]MCM2294692.1 hypothetical protein [Allorhizobium sonneratiae]